MFPDIDSVTSKRRISIVDLGLILELQIFFQHLFHLGGISFLGDKGDTFYNALYRVQCSAAVPGEIGFAALERFVLIGNAELAEIAKVFESFAHQKGHKSRVHHRCINFHKGYFEALAVLRQDSALAQSIIGKYARINDRELLQESQRASIPHMPIRPYVNKDWSRAV
jgi:hypothetical protein